MPAVNTRVFFSKTGRAKYISHLDLNHCVQRALRRSGLPVWQTEGFNPHTYISFMLPLSLGQEGINEVMDFKLIEELPHIEVTNRLNQVLPPDIRVIKTAEPVHKGSDISSAVYEIYGDFDFNKFGEFIKRDKLVTEKKTKKGITQVDIKPYIYSAEINDKITLRLPAGNSFTINPSLLLELFASETGTELGCVRIVRTSMFCENGEIFS